MMFNQRKITFTLSLILILFGALYYISPYRVMKVPSSSMYPSLKVGQWLILKKSAKFKAGDIVVFRDDFNHLYIKRVIAKSNDFIEIDLDSRVITINNKKISKNIVKELDYTDNGKDNVIAEKLHGSIYRLELNNSSFEQFLAAPTEHLLLKRENNCRYFFKEKHFYGLKCKIPAAYFFVLGDNFEGSIDSRHFGFVPDKYYIGKIKSIK